MTITKTEAPQFLDFLRGPSPQELSERIGLLQEVVFREAKQRLDQDKWTLAQLRAINESDRSMNGSIVTLLDADANRADDQRRADAETAIKVLGYQVQQLEAKVQRLEFQLAQALVPLWARDGEDKQFLMN